MAALWAPSTAASYYYYSIGGSPGFESYRLSLGRESSGSQSQRLLLLLAKVRMAPPSIHYRRSYEVREPPPHVGRNVGVRTPPPPSTVRGRWGFESRRLLLLTELRDPKPATSNYSALLVGIRGPNFNVSQYCWRKFRALIAPPFYTDGVTESETHGLLLVESSGSESRRLLLLAGVRGANPAASCWWKHRGPSPASF